MFNADWLEEARVVPVILVERDFGYRGGTVGRNIVKSGLHENSKETRSNQGVA